MLQVYLFLLNKGDSTMNMCSSVCDSFVTNCGTNIDVCTKISVNVKNYNEFNIRIILRTQIVSLKFYLFKLFYNFIMDSKNVTKNENIGKTDTNTVSNNDSVKKDNPNDMKKFITKVDNRVKTKVNR